MCFFFILINYTLKGLLVASSHTIKLCRSFHIKKKKKSCCESNKEKDSEPLPLAYHESKWKRGMLETKQKVH